MSLGSIPKADLALTSTIAYDRGHPRETPVLSGRTVGVDYAARTDVRTEWFTQAGVELRSKGQTRSILAMRVAFLVHALVDH